jgi:hypothetical protein
MKKLNVLMLVTFLFGCSFSMLNANDVSTSYNPDGIELRNEINDTIQHVTFDYGVSENLVLEFYIDVDRKIQILDNSATELGKDIKALLSNIEVKSTDYKINKIYTLKVSHKGFLISAELLERENA